MINTIKELHSRWMTNRKIAQAIWCHHKTIWTKLKSLWLTPNWNWPKKLNIVSDNKAICSKCNCTKPITDFQYSHTNKWRLSYCNDCRNNQTCDRINYSIESYLSHRIWQLKTRANRVWIKYNLDIEYILWLYEFQKWNCFYTDIKLSIVAWWWKNKDSLSFDKIIPSLWYVKWNVVLCTTQVNTCKNDITLDEMKEWMPCWYDRVLNYQVDYGNF